MKMPRILLIAVAAALLPLSLAHAEIYRWVDEHGVVHFQDTPPPGTRPATTVREVPSGAPSAEGLPAGESAEGDAPASGKAAPKAPAARKPVKLRANPKVEIYGTGWCPYCRMARDYFRARGIAFEDYDVEKDLDALRRKKEYDPDGGVPTTVIDGKVIRGFSADAYEKALEAPAE